MYNYTDDARQHGLDVHADVHLHTATNAHICCAVFFNYNTSLVCHQQDHISKYKTIENTKTQY